LPANPFFERVCCVLGLATEAGLDRFWLTRPRFMHEMSVS
jgi:hypothetical protein